MIHQINGTVAKEAVNDNVWEIERMHRGDAPACLRSVLVRRTDAHPLWRDYMVSLVHLRHVDGLPPASLRSPTSTHEITIFALDPDACNQPNDDKEIKVLRSIILAYQLESLDDTLAEVVFSAFVRMLSSGGLSPDTDFRQAQIAFLQRANSFAKSVN